MKGARRFEDYLKEKLKNKEFKKSFDEEGIYAEVAIQIARLRVQKRLSQKRLAHLLHTSQQTISRLEDPDNSSYSLRTLIKLAHILGKKLEVQFV
jgi:DNA-binding XRE family transcriptional regulator